jgi:hypothetical protein
MHEALDSIPSTTKKKKRKRKKENENKGIFYNPNRKDADKAVLESYWITFETTRTWRSLRVVKTSNHNPRLAGKKWHRGKGRAQWSKREIWQ